MQQQWCGILGCVGRPPCPHALCLFPCTACPHWTAALLLEAAETSHKTQRPKVKPNNSSRGRLVCSPIGCCAPACEGNGVYIYCCIRIIVAGKSLDPSNGRQSEAEHCTIRDSLLSTSSIGQPLHRNTSELAVTKLMSYGIA